MVCNKKRKPVFIKRKWNHVVFSRAKILSFHPVEGPYRSWDLYTTGQRVDGLHKKKRKPVFIKRKWNHVVFSRATILSFHPIEGSYRSWDLHTTGQLVDGLQQKKENRFSLNGNGKHVVFSRATILSFHRVLAHLLNFSLILFHKEHYDNIFFTHSSFSTTTTDKQVLKKRELCLQSAPKSFIGRLKEQETQVSKLIKTPHC